MTRFKARELTVADGVEFTITTEPDELPKTMADMMHPDDVLAISRRLRAGDHTAWCTVIVTAEWRGFKGSDSLGGCVLGASHSKHDAAHCHDMKGEALRRLNERIADTVNELSDVASLADRDDYEQRWLAECRAHGETRRKLQAAHHELGDHSLCDGDCSEVES